MTDWTHITVTPRTHHRVSRLGGARCEYGGDMDDRRQHAHVHCMCGHLALKLLLSDDGSAYEEWGDCEECGAHISVTLGVHDGLVARADDGEREEACEIDWPKWALKAWDSRLAGMLHD